jgi:gamma-glutamylcyclotransferase (GGCT)/AIG2-like uncharacterized protein YtfP
MLYFAYGSNLDPRQMERRCPGHHVVGLAALADHRLAFPRFTPDWGGGTCGPVHAHGQQLWGVVFEVTDEHMAALDSYEGFRGAGDQHNAYDRETVTVDLVRPDDGSVPRRLRATTYFARASNPQPPSRRYLETILRGAAHHRLPEDYVEALRKTEAGEEPTDGGAAGETDGS